MTENSSHRTFGLFSSGPGRAMMNRLTAQKIDYLEFPAAELVEKKLTPDENNIFREIAAYQWLIFAETASVEIFFSHLAENTIDFFELDHLRIAVLDELTADRLRFEQIHSDLIFTAKDEPGEMIKKFIADEDELRNSKFLLFKGSGRELEIENSLAQNLLNYRALELFEALPVKSEDSGRLKALLKGGAIEDFLLTSTDDLISLEMYCADAGGLSVQDELNLYGTDENFVRYLRERGYRARIYK